MANNVYEGGEGDARQSEDENLKPGLFRNRYRKLTAEEVELHDRIKAKAEELAVLIVSIPSPEQPCSSDLITSLAEGRAANKTLALRHLEDAVYRGVKALTS